MRGLRTLKKALRVVTSSRVRTKRDTSECGRSKGKKLSFHATAKEEDFKKIALPEDGSTGCKNGFPYKSVVENAWWCFKKYLRYKAKEVWCLCLHKPGYKRRLM